MNGPWFYCVKIDYNYLCLSKSRLNRTAFTIYTHARTYIHVCYYPVATRGKRKFVTLSSRFFGAILNWHMVFWTGREHLLFYTLYSVFVATCVYILHSIIIIFVIAHESVKVCRKICLLLQNFITVQLYYFRFRMTQLSQIICLILLRFVSCAFYLFRVYNIIIFFVFWICALLFLLNNLSQVLLLLHILRISADFWTHIFHRI